MRWRSAGFGGVALAGVLAVQGWAAVAPFSEDLTGAPVDDAPYALHAPDLVAPLSLEALVRAAMSGPMDGIDLHNISYSVDGEVQTVPLPAALPALVLGLGVLGVATRRWKVA